MKYALLYFGLLVTTVAGAQESDTTDGGVCKWLQEELSKGKYVYVEHMPVSGYDIQAYLQRNLHYPDSAQKKGIEGRVVVKFIVLENGAIDSVSILKGKGIGGGCDEEAVRVVKNMPPWKPGKDHGKPVKVHLTLPIQFKLKD